MSKSQSRIFSRLQYFPYIVFVWKIERGFFNELSLIPELFQTKSGYFENCTWKSLIGNVKTHSRTLIKFSNAL